MTNLHITLDTDNAAFRKNGWRKEAAHVLTKFAAQLVYSGSGKTTGALQDTDGEACGDWDYVADEPENEDQRLILTHSEREALRQLLRYVSTDEHRHWQENDCPKDHVYHSIRALQRVCTD